MKMGKKQVVVFLCALAVSLLVLKSLAQEEPRKPGNESDKELSELMKRKLTNAQKVLEGIAVNDFDKISNHAEELILISKQAEWKVMKTPQYEMFSNDFRRSAAELVEKAKQKNLDGAALSYVDLTLACVKCHKYVRESRQSKLDRPGKDAVALGYPW
jgi:hypothetical protein